MKIDYYYSGVDGDTLRLECESLRDLQILKAVFETLRVGHLDRIDLADRFDFGLSAVRRIQLVRVAQRDYRECEITRTTNHAFVWSADTLDLTRYDGLIDGLIACSEEGDAYQVLTSDTARCIAVELTSPRSR